MDSGFRSTRFKIPTPARTYRVLVRGSDCCVFMAGVQCLGKVPFHGAFFSMSAGATVRTIALHSLHSITAISPPDYSTQTAPAVWISEVRIRNGCDKLTIRVHALAVCGGRPGATFDGRQHELQIPAFAFFTFAHRALAGFSGAPSTGSRRTPSAAAVLCRIANPRPRQAKSIAERPRRTGTLQKAIRPEGFDVVRCPRI